MIISVLTDNIPGKDTPAEHGLSCLLEHDGKKVLFDTGQSGLFLRNVAVVRIPLDHLDAIGDRIIFLGKIPRITDFESNQSTFVMDNGKVDFVMDDSAIALVGDQGLFVITGCGHAGIVNTLEQAQKVTGIGSRVSNLRSIPPFS